MITVVAATATRRDGTAEERGPQREQHEAGRCHRHVASRWLRRRGHAHRERGRRARRVARAATPASISPAAVTRWHTPSTANAAVMIHRSVAPRAANALIVLCVELYQDGWRAAASVHPPINAIGAIVAETTTKRRIPAVCRRTNRPQPTRRIQLGCPHGCCGGGPGCRDRRLRDRGVRQLETEPRWQAHAARHHAQAGTSPVIASPSQRQGSPAIPASWNPSKPLGAKNYIRQPGVATYWLGDDGQVHLDWQSRYGHQQYVGTPLPPEVPHESSNRIMLWTVLGGRPWRPRDRLPLQHRRRSGPAPRSARSPQHGRARGRAPRADQLRADSGPPTSTRRNSTRYTGVSSLIGPACAARARRASRPSSPDRRTSAVVIAESGISSTDTTSMVAPATL